MPHHTTLACAGPEMTGVLIWLIMLACVFFGSLFIATTSAKLSKSERLKLILVVTFLYCTIELVVFTQMPMLISALFAQFPSFMFGDTLVAFTTLVGGWLILPVILVWLIQRGPRTIALLIMHRIALLVILLYFNDFSLFNTQYHSNLDAQYFQENPTTVLYYVGRNNELIRHEIGTKATVRTETAVEADHKLVFIQSNNEAYLCTVGKPKGYTYPDPRFYASTLEDVDNHLLTVDGSASQLRTQIRGIIEDDDRDRLWLEDSAILNDGPWVYSVTNTFGSLFNPKYETTDQKIRRGLSGIWFSGCYWRVSSPLSPREVLELRGPWSLTVLNNRDIVLYNVDTDSMQIIGNGRSIVAYFPTAEPSALPPSP